MNRTTQTQVKSSSRKALTAAANAARDKIHGATAGPSSFERAYARYQDAQAEFLSFFDTPTWKRTLCAWVIGCATALGVGWLAGNVITFMMAGAVLATGSMFLASVIMVLGVIASMYYGGKIAARVFGAVITGEADERAIAAYDATRSFLRKINPFSAKVAVPVAA